MKKRKIVVQGVEISIFSQNEQDYISITDIAKKFGQPDKLIAKWLNNSGTRSYLKTWEQMENPNFNIEGYKNLLLELEDASYDMSVKRWLEATYAIGIQAKRGRGGGTYAHRDIALQFCYWKEPVFQLYFFREFQRLKFQEAQLLGEKWDVNRYLSKMNYHIHTEAIKEFLTEPKQLDRKSSSNVYASEADLLNKAVFGLTAKEWRLQCPEAKGNIRDNASRIDLHVLANLEVLNARLIKYGLPQKARLEELMEAAVEHQEILKEKTCIIKS